MTGTGRGTGVPARDGAAARTRISERASRAGTGRRRRRRPIEVAIVNNMPDAAFEATERQFARLVDEAAGDRPVTVRLSSLPDPGRGVAVRRTLSERYETLGTLLARPPDAVVVTGSEPRCGDLRDEVTWESLSRLVAWAERSTSSALLSCLAAHGALLATDGIARRPLPAKLSGVYPQAVRGNHPLTAGVGPLRIPHSRRNDVPVDALEAHGYEVLASSEEAGWTVAVRDGPCLRVLVQGHPEYSPSTLLREYRRDVRRYLAGALDAYPELPEGYLDAEATRLAVSFRAAAEGPGGSDLDVAQAFPFHACAAGIAADWQSPAVRLFANWLTEVETRKAGQARRRAG